MSRKDVCSALWKNSINSSPAVIEAYAASPHEVIADGRAALVAAREKGVSDAELAAIFELAAYEAAFSTLLTLSENGCLGDEYDCLYEDLITSR